LGCPKAAGCCAGRGGLQLPSGTSQDGDPQAGDREPHGGDSKLDIGCSEGTKPLPKVGTGHSPIPSTTGGGRRGSHRPLSPGLRGLGYTAGDADPSCGQGLGPAQCQHLQVCREKWRLSVAGAAGARAEGSAWPSRYWMERSWKQGSASSTTVARSALRRDTDRCARDNLQGHPAASPASSPPTPASMEPGKHAQMQPKGSSHPPPPPPPPPSPRRGSGDRYGASALAEAAALSRGWGWGAAGWLKQPAPPRQGYQERSQNGRGWQGPLWVI